MVEVEADFDLRKGQFDLMKNGKRRNWEHSSPLSSCFQHRSMKLPEIGQKNIDFVFQEGRCVGLPLRQVREWSFPIGELVDITSQTIEHTDPERTERGLAGGVFAMMTVLETDFATTE
jgi:hypothetical protein